MAKQKRRKNQHKDEEYSELMDAWMDYSEDMTQRIMAITKERAKEFEELNEIWTEYVQKMTKQISSATPDDAQSFKKMQKLVGSYTKEISERFQDIMTENDGPYGDLYKVWTQYSQRMGNQISDLLSDTMNEQNDLYEIWMDTFGLKDNHRHTKYPVDYSDINRFWQDMWEDSRKLYNPWNLNGQKGASEHIKDLHDLWMGAYNKVVMGFVKSPQFAQMNGNILDANLDIKNQNQEFVSQYLESLGFPTKENIDEIYHKLHEMDKKLSRISRDVKSRRTQKGK